MARSLVVCCDGTWNSADQDGAPTNVTKMARAILPQAQDGAAQIVYYDEGVGSGNFLDRIVGGAFGTGLETNVQQAYRFLCQNYQPGDRICLFGFSRGAYTVRSLAGLVSLVGLLRKGDLDRMPKVWDYYRTPPEEREPEVIDPAWIGGRFPEVTLIGVWDTVGALGIPANGLGRIGRKRHSFHDVKLGERVRNAFQALAIDEHRKTFAPAIWETAGLPAHEQAVEQVWFAGAHSNVGGGYPDSLLSDIALLWMFDKARPFLALDEDYVARKVQKVEAGAPRGVLVDSSKGAFWKIQGRIDRALGKDPTEQIHQSAIDRFDFSGRTPRPAPDAAPYNPFPYLPANLKRYLQGKGPIA